MTILDINWAAFLPPFVLLITAIIAIFFSLFERESTMTALASLVGLTFAAVVNVALFTQVNHTGEIYSSFGLQYISDPAALGFNFVILIGTALAILMSYDYLRRTGLEHPEYYPLMLLSATGAMVMAAAGDLIVLLLGLEIMSLAVYVLSAWRQNARESEEAGMKYFLLGAFASAFLIYGIALLYGATGAFTYTGIVTALQSGAVNGTVYALLGSLMVLAGLGFKVAFAPFHQWAPDVYTGAPTAVTGFMSVVVKAAAFAALLRVSASFFAEMPPLFTQVFVVLIVLTLFVGNLGALLQQSVKRMLAYSAVAHTGYLGLAVLASDTVGMQAAIWYLSAYAFMNAGAFAVLTLITDSNDHGDSLERLAGLGRTRPLLAAAMTVFMLSLAGIPLLAGFVGKVFVFQAAIQQGYLWLAIFGIITSIVAVVYYFRPIAYMLFREPEYQPVQTKSQMTGIAIGVAVVATFALGIFAGWWYRLLAAGQQIVAGM